MSSARILFYSLMPRSVGYSRKITIHVEEKEIGRVPRLAIGESLRKKEFCLFHCDAKWNHLGFGGSFKSIIDAKKEAELMYPGVTSTWIKTNVSKREAKKIEKEIWRDYECSFCGRIMLDFQMMVRGKKAAICNICVNENYYIFLELQQEESVRRPRGDYYPENGFDHVESYVSRLLTSTMQRRSVLISTLDGERGCSLFADGPMVLVCFIIMDSQQDHKKEKKIRKFFGSIDKTPAKDYLAQDGRVRILDYPVNGNAKQITTITKEILQKFYDVSPTEGLSIKYSEK